MRKVFHEDSDKFFNHWQAEDAFRGAPDRDTASLGLVDAAAALIKRGEITDIYTAEEYAADFMGRV